MQIEEVFWYDNKYGSEVYQAIAFDGPRYIDDYAAFINGDNPIEYHKKQAMERLAKHLNAP